MADLTADSVITLEDVEVTYSAITVRCLDGDKTGEVELDRIVKSTGTLTKVATVGTGAAIEFKVNTSCNDATTLDFKLDGTDVDFDYKDPTANGDADQKIADSTGSGTLETATNPKPSGYEYVAVTVKGLKDVKEKVSLTAENNASGKNIVTVKVGGKTLQAYCTTTSATAANLVNVAEGGNDYITLDESVDIKNADVKVTFENAVKRVNTDGKVIAGTDVTTDSTVVSVVEAKLSEDGKTMTVKLSGVLDKTKLITVVANRFIDIRDTATNATAGSGNLICKLARNTNDNADGSIMGCAGLFLIS